MSLLSFPFIHPLFPLFSPPPDIPPPRPPPNFSAMSEEEVRRMEGSERQHVEARIRVLRNIQTLLDAAVVQVCGRDWGQASLFVFYYYFFVYFFKYPETPCTKCFRFILLSSIIHFTHELFPKALFFYFILNYLYVY